MRTLIIYCFLVGLSSIVSAVLGVREIYFVHAQNVPLNHALFRMVSSIFVSSFCGAAIYGIHKKALVAWRIGWAVLALGFLECFRRALALSAKIAPSDYPNVAAASFIVSAAAVALYWGRWWGRQRSYFVN